MMLVMLMSVTGAWAQNNVIRYTATSQIANGWGYIGSYSNTQIITHTFDPASQLGVVTYEGDITAIPESALSGENLISIVLPSSVTSIGKLAFAHCKSLTSIDLPSRLISIGDFTFQGCNSLTSLDISAGVTDFGFHVTSQCSSLKTIIINSQQTLDAIGYYIEGIRSIIYTFDDDVEKIVLRGNITNIPGFKFQSSSITCVTIPQTVTSIGSYAFSECPLQSITVFANTPPSITDDSFYNVDKSIPVYVPVGTVAAYQAASGWNEFTNIMEYLPYRLTLVSSNSSLGKPYGAGIYDYGTELTICAVPEADSKFTGWSDGNTENPRKYVVTNDAVLTANFEKVFEAPTGAGMRMKVTRKNGKVYEFNTSDIESTEYYRATE